ncbi:hypothetical protein [Hymenobacter koreensis]|uniref:dUTP diphosphatase n=1 Tax=Hymenobacter koreensis TaxID=1084523 RepID=A0ABP8JKQ3_9BACT
MSNRIVHIDCNVKIKLLHPKAVLPSKANHADACFDVVAVSREVKDGYIEYGLGFATEIPVGWEAKFYPRSSISKYDLALANSVATIDADYRGEWKARYRPTNRVFITPGSINTDRPLHAAYVGAPVIYEVGDKVGQISFQRVPEVTFEQVESLPETARGAGGFGSTGK